MKIIASCVNIG